VCLFVLTKRDQQTKGGIGTEVHHKKKEREKEVLSIISCECGIHTERTNRNAAEVRAGGSDACEKRTKENNITVGSRFHAGGPDPVNRSGWKGAAAKEAAKRVLLEKTKHKQIKRPLGARRSLHGREQSNPKPAL